MLIAKACRNAEGMVQYNENARLDPSQVRSGGGRRGTVAVGGGMALVVVILGLLLGFNPMELLGNIPDQPSAPGAVSDFAECETGADIATKRECRFVAYTNSIQSYWQATLPGYEKADTVMFSGVTQTGCGTATSAVGPFYCPVDRTIYLDGTFFDDMLKGQLGAAGGDAAEAYVIAHEYGHHIQNLTGILPKVQAAGQRSGPDSPQVKLELQADCYAGAWLSNATMDPNSPITSVTQDDLDRAVNAAIAVGDDRIQRAQTGQVKPDAWTHGSSADRKHWFGVGFKTGDPSQCNTFAAGALG